MLFPPDFERKIGFDQIRELLEGFCISGLGQEEVKKISFFIDNAEISRLLSETEEFRQILLSGDPFPSLEVSNTIPLLQHLRIENSFPEPEQLKELVVMLGTWLEIQRFFEGERQNIYPLLADCCWLLANGYWPLAKSQKPKAKSQQADRRTGGQADRRMKTTFIAHPPSRHAKAWSPLCYDIAHLITSIIDDKSNVKDSASKELARIRREINRLQSGIRKRMEQIFGEAKKSGWTEEDAEVTVRDGRLVIPFRSAHKRKIQGVMHDASATGQTVYLEPVELFEMNNEIRELHYAERREIIRILTEVANRIRPSIDELTGINHLLGQLDAIRAKARFALDIGGIFPSRVFDHPHLQWNQAIHPLLFLSHRKAKKQVVPLDITLSPEARVLVISGPNAGGKSICLKTVGLLQYMLQCGLLPPVREDSEFGLFRQIMIDIGDEQSLENDLSTYTSKLLNMKHFIDHLDNSSLFLIDEMGTGTDPSVGGAIAEAALLSMAASGACGVVTTHYSNLKLLAETSGQADKRTSGQENNEGLYPTSRIPHPASRITNAAMLFDTKTMRPLYQLRIGKPGSSFAIEIARSIGFPQKELDYASQLIGGSQLNFEQQLQDLEVEKAEFAKKKREVQVADDFIAELIAKYQKLTAGVEASRKEILAKAREEAQQILRDSNKLIERTIKEIRESQAERERTKAARSAIRDARDAIRDPRSEMSDPRFAIDNLQPPMKKAESGDSDPASRIAHPASVDNTKNRSLTDMISNRRESFALTLDLRGKRADEAFLELQRFIDDAILLSVREVRILHGKGTGALREVTRSYLKTRKEVVSFADEQIERGGAGITVVNLG